jgi:hypothetical protein
MRIKIILIVIFITTFVYSQDTYYFWNDVGISVQELFDKMNKPDDIEYQPESNNYWFAYDFGDAAVIYIVSRGLVSSVIYMKNNRSYDDIHFTFSEMYRISRFYGFSSFREKNYFKSYRNGIKLTGNISVVENEFILTILVSKVEKKQNGN